MVDVGALLKKPSFLLKLVELVLTIICVGLLQDLGPYGFISINVHKRALVNMVMCGYLLITPMQIVGKLMEEVMPKKLALAWSVIGAILWLAAGALVLQVYDNGFPSHFPIVGAENQYLASGIIAVINGFVFLLDAGATFKFD